MKTLNNTIINSIMKNLSKYMRSLLIVMGICISSTMWAGRGDFCLPINQVSLTGLTYTGSLTCIPAGQWDQNLVLTYSIADGYSTNPEDYSFTISSGGYSMTWTGYAASPNYSGNLSISGRTLTITLYASYWCNPDGRPCKYGNSGISVTAAAEQSCNSPSLSLTAAGGTTMTWNHTDVTKQINYTRSGSGKVSWGLDVSSSVATISNSGLLTVKEITSSPTTIRVTATVAEKGDYCEESKYIDITVNAQTYTVTYHLDGVTKTSGPTSVSCLEDDLNVYFSINSGHTGEGKVGRVIVYDGGGEDWCYSTSTYSGCAVENIEFGTGTRLDYVNDGTFSSNVDVYITAPVDVCTEPVMTWTTGTNRTVAYGDAGWTDAVTVTYGGNPTGQTVTYESTNTSAATVTSTGVVEIVGTGTTTITATVARLNQYCEKTVSYTITVNCATPTTSANELGKEMTANVIDPTSARIEGGIIVSLGGSATNTAHGYVYGINHNPTLSDNEKGWSGSNVVPMRAEGKKWGGWNITSLSPGTTYYVRTYVTTACGGTGYSPTEVSFTTPNAYSISYDANGGEGSISEQVKLEHVDITLSDGSGFSRTGYDLLKWNTQADGGGANYALGATYSTDADLELYAIWQAKTYTLALDNQSPTTTSTPTSVTVTYGQPTNLTGTVVTTLPTKTGYTFGGYYTGTSGSGVQLITETGIVNASVATYTDGDKKWLKADDVTVYAKWTANEIDIVLDANGGNSDGEGTVVYDATSLSSINHATYAGHTLEGYYAEAGHATKVLNNDGSFAASTVSGYITGGKWSRTTDPTTLYAFWASNPQTVTFDLDGKGDNFTRVVDNGTPVERPTDPTHIDYNFDDWYTDDGTGHASNTKYDFSANVTSDFTIYAKWIAKEYKDLIFACVDINLVTEDNTPILVTSRNGINVMATKKLKVTVTGALPGHRVTMAGTDLKFYRNDGTRFIELTGSNSLVAPLDEQEVYVSYNPGSAGTGGSPATPSITVACDGFEDTFSGKIKARNLPDAVAIVARVGNSWHALPANISGEATPAPIMVSTATEDEILKAYGPSTVRYKLWQTVSVNSANDRWGDKYATPAALHADYLRFAGNDNKGLWANNSTTNNGISNYGAITTTNSPLDNDPAYEWKVTTTEVDGQFVYTLQTDQTKNGNNLRLWGKKWGTYGSSYGIAEVYILPLVIKEPADLTIMEWGTSEIAVKYANADKVKNGTFKVKIDNGSESAVTVTSLGGDIYKLTNIGNMQNNPAKTLTLTMTEVIDATEYAKQAVFAIPLIVTAEKTEAQISSYAAGGDGSTLITEGRAIAKGLDVIIRNGGKLTTGTGQGKFADLYVYPGGKVELSNNIGFSNIYLRGGFSWLDASKDYRLPQMKVDDDLTIDGVQSTGNGIYYDIYLDKTRYYMVAVPREVLLSDITNEEGGEEFTAWLKYYDGEGRTLNPKRNGWQYIASEAMYRGIGYELSIKPRVTGRTIGILRLPLLKETAWTNEDGTPCTPAVKAWGYNNASVSANNKGWNFMANPYFTTFRNTDEDGRLGKYMEIQGLKQHKDEHGNWTGTFDWDGDPEAVKYVTIPQKMYDDYIDVRAKNYDLEAFYPFFIQAKENGVLTFENGNRVIKAMPSLWKKKVAAREINIDFNLIDAQGKTDVAGLNICDDYSSAFDMEDKEKTISSTNYMKVYTMVGSYRTAFNSLPEETAAQPISVGYIAPGAGKYIFSVKENGNYSDVAQILLTDYETAQTVDLLLYDYEFSTEAGEFNERFVLNVELKKEEITSSVENLNTNNLWNMSVFGANHSVIIHGLPAGSNVWVYDVTGKLVATWTKTQDARLQTTVPTYGVYFVRAVLGNQAVTKRALVLW